MREPGGVRERERERETDRQGKKKMSTKSMSSLHLSPESLHQFDITNKA